MMLKLFIHIACDECGQQFLFARESAYTTDALRFNTNALTAMLPHYHWQTTKTQDERYHYCMECCYQFVEMEEEASNRS